MAEQQRLLGGRYLLKEKVGTGGMATVFRAQDQVLNRAVAVKIMLPQYAGDPTFAARFKQEAQAAAALQSPYIVGVYDWGKDGDTYYIVMELLHGTDLKSGVRSHGALDPKKVAQIGSQICGALSIAHKHEIIHRDIKPQNIMVQPDGNIKVMDFGIARAKNSHLTQDNNVLGTAHYVSPEQTRGQELGPTSDIYSLGVVMYECATGRVPFDGDDAISVALKQVNELPVPPSQINANVDGDLERIILKCMEKDPANRFQTADELRQVLNSYLAGRAVDVPEPTRVIAGMAGAGGTEAMRMGDKTQTMVRPTAPGDTASNPVIRPNNQINTSSYDNEKHGMGKGKIAAIAIAIVAFVAIAVFAVSGFLNGGDQKSVPNLLGMEQEAAVSSIKSSGFEPGNVNQSYNDQYPEGQVCEQTPDGSKTAAAGSKIDIVISKGSKPIDQVEVPDLSNASDLDEAKKLIENAGLTVGSTTQEANDADEGKIVDQSPKAGEKVDKGSKVDIVVSSGPETDSVPGVVGKTESDATNTLSNAGFSVNVESGGTSDTYAKGYVMKQSPTGTAKKGSTVTIYISEGKDTSSDEVDVDSLGLTGMTAEDAEEAIANAGLKYDPRQQSSSSVEVGNVIKYSPGGKQPAGTVIILYISTGPSE